MRWLMAILALTVAMAANAANVVFVTPQQGGQAVGPQLIEITTDAANVDRVEFYVDGVLVGVARRAPFRIAHDFGTELQSREITVKVFSSGYRNTDVAKIATAALTAGESINVDVVEVPLRVRANRTLRPDDLRVRESSVDQTIRELKPGRGAAHFAFVVDRSLSMGGGKLEAALRAVDEAKTMLRADDSASLILFNHNVGTARPLSQGVPVNVVPSGGTSLRDAVSSSLECGGHAAALPCQERWRGHRTPERTYAIVITDGGDRNSVLSDEEALRKISGTKTIVAALVFGRASRFLQRAAKNTGGALANTTRSSVSNDLRGMIADINSRYTLVYQSRGTKSGWRSIAITPRRSGIEILNARKGYFAE